MAIKCGACKLTHLTLAEVKACFSGERSFPRDCRHQLPPLWCTLCSRRRGWNWSPVFEARYEGKCRYCATWIEEGDLVRKRGSTVAHPGCVEDPARAATAPTLYWLDGDALGSPDWVVAAAITAGWDARIDQWLVEARLLELDLTEEMWEQLLADIDDDEMLGLLLTETLSDPDAITVELEE